MIDIGTYRDRVVSRLPEIASPAQLATRSPVEAKHHDGENEPALTASAAAVVAKFTALETLRRGVTHRTFAGTRTKFESST